MKAALLTAQNAPLEVAEVELGELTFGQVLVRVLVSGLCGAQLQEIRGEKGGPLPHLMGHEGCGIVERIGSAVTRVKPGDKVVMHWRKADGIESSLPVYKFGGANFNSGRVVTLAEVAICSENRLTPVPLDTPRDLAALLGCGLSTALATVERDAAIKFGESVLVVGCGGLGVNLIRAARMANAGEVGAVDVYEHKRPVALAMGADHYGARAGAGARCDCILDTVGSPASIAANFPALAPSGRYILIGQPAPGAAVTLPDARRLFDGDGQTIRATQGGGFRPHLDIPRYLALHRRGALNTSGIVTHRFPLADINAAFDRLRAGEASRIMIDVSG